MILVILVFVVKGNIIVTKKTFTADDFLDPNTRAANAASTNIANNNAFDDEKLVSKNNAPFINRISKINGVKIDNAEDLYVVSRNYKKTTGSSWNYYRDGPSNPLSSNSESFKYKKSITGNTYNVGVGEEGYDANKVGKN